MVSEYQEWLSEYQEVIKDMEQELGFTLRPLPMIYGLFFPYYASVYSKPPQFSHILNSNEITAPEELLTYVDMFYTATLLYYREYPIIPFRMDDDFREFFFVNEENADGMETGFTKLIQLEARIPDIIHEFDPAIPSDFVMEWNQRAPEVLKKLSKIVWWSEYWREKRWQLQETYKRSRGKWVKTYKRVRKPTLKTKKATYKASRSVKISALFRDELITRMSFYRRLREELAQALHKEIRDFSALHTLFERYFGRMRFFELGARYEGALYDYGRAYLRKNKVEYLQEYFFAVREYYKEVIQCTLRMVESDKYSDEMKKELLKHIALDWYLQEITCQENIWYLPIFEGTDAIDGTWRYNFYFEWRRPKNVEDPEELTRFLENTYEFITKNPRFGHSYPSDPAVKLIMESILESKPIDPDDLAEKL